MHYDRVSGLVVLVVVTVGARPSGTWLPAGKCYFDYYYLPHLVQEKYISGALGSASVCGRCDLFVANAPPVRTLSFILPPPSDLGTLVRKATTGITLEMEEDRFPIIKIDQIKDN